MAGLFNPIGWWDKSGAVAPTPTPTPLPTNTPLPTATATPSPTPTAAPASYVTTSLYNYFDTADSNSFSGVGNTILNLGTSGSLFDGTFEGDATYPGSGSFISFSNAGGTQGNFSLRNVSNNLVVDPVPVPTAFTYEAGFKITQSSSYVFSLINFRNSTGIFWSGDRFVFQGIAGYTFPTSLTNNYVVGDAYILTVVGNGTSLKVYLNGVEEWSTTITSQRPSPATNGRQGYGCYVNGGANNGGQTYDWSYHRYYDGLALTPAQVVSNYNYSAPALGLTPIP
jgi:hypothetical protein